MTSNGEISPALVLEEWIAPEIRTMHKRKRTIEIVDTEALERIQTELAIVALPLKNLKTVSEKEEAITNPTYAEHKVVMVLSRRKIKPYAIPTIKISAINISTLGSDIPLQAPFDAAKRLSNWGNYH